MAGAMALPPTHNFDYYIGDTGSFVVDITDTDQLPYDLTGFTTKFVIADSPALVPAWSILGDAVITGSSVTCTIMPAIGEQIGIAAGTATEVHYDVEIVNNDGTLVQTVLRGVINLTIGVNEVI